jgi:hypothetical protein
MIVAIDQFDKSCWLIGYLDAPDLLIASFGVKGRKLIHRSQGETRIARVVRRHRVQEVPFRMLPSSHRPARSNGLRYCRGGWHTKRRLRLTGYRRFE